MVRVQKLFEMIAGITRHERERYEFARAFFGQQPFDCAALHTPACWRRGVAAGQASATRPARRPAPR